MELDTKIIDEGWRNHDTVMRECGVNLDSYADIYDHDTYKKLTAKILAASNIIAQSSCGPFADKCYVGSKLFDILKSNDSVMCFDDVCICMVCGITVVKSDNLHDDVIAVRYNYKQSSYAFKFILL